MGICEGTGMIVLGCFIVYASWKDYSYNKKYDKCSQRVRKIKTVKIVKTHRKNAAVK